ncbi:MAG: hypothetical protein EOO77_03145 [Oxalobacteraceae bacterium]|nr:MAG: hypothetical protein EOO77_03145 [Oxalobacteraceae bacterium]
MDDGFSGVTGYALGRMSAQRERSLQDFGKALQRRFRPAAPTVDVNALMAENEMLRQQLADSQADLRELEGIYSRLKAWGTQASQVLDHYGLIAK